MTSFKVQYNFKIIEQYYSKSNHHKPIHFYFSCITLEITAWDCSTVSHIIKNYKSVKLFQWRFDKHIVLK